MSSKHVLIEQLGASSESNSPWVLAHASDLLNKVLPGGIARLKVARDDNEQLNLDATSPFIEQLGVASGKYGLPHVKHFGAALFGLTAKIGVTRYWGVDLRAEANEYIERNVLQWPIEERKKTLLVTLLYEAARRLPGR
jgi:hypothetical protein